MERAKTYAVITGASSGIGMNMARRLAQEGYSLLLVARRTDRLKSVKEEMEKYYLSKEAVCEIFTADLGKLTDCWALVNSLSEKTVAIFVNNAGFGDCGAFLDTDLDKELSMIDVNIKAVHYLTKMIVRKMDKQNGGYILNVASSAGLIPAGPYMATYYATKAYVVSLTRAVARELEEKNSRVYIGALCPGPVDTEFNSVANVEFSLKGITAEACADYAVDMMKKRKKIIIPGLIIKLAAFAAKVSPSDVYISAVANQQKKKLGQ